MRARLFALALALTVLHPLGAQAPRIVRLTFIGDIMAHNVTYRMRDFRDIYRGVEEVLRGADLTVANLELPVDPTRPEAGYPFFNGNMAYVRAAADAGVNLLSVANNHAFDGGIEGVFQTIRVLGALPSAAARRVAYSGIRGNPHRPFLPVSLTVGGVRVGFIAATQFINERDPGGHVDVVDYADAASAEAFVRLVTEVSPLYDLFVVSYHGDREYAAEPSLTKKAFFRRLLEAGAQVVFSHHPHVVQGYEVRRVRGTDRLIMYSMGNFVSGMTWGMDPSMLSEGQAATAEGYMLSVEVRCDGGGCTVARVVPLPIADYPNERGEMVVGRLEDLASGIVGTRPGWKTYFRGRLEKMMRFLAGQG
jgi:poly-gamma-glutamate synthesis protein (capsule biosynthesis protein)